MKLKNIIAPLQQKIRKILSLRKFNPSENRGRRAIANELTRRGRRKLENLEFSPQEASTISTSDRATQKITSYHFAPPPNLYPQYHKCDRNEPLECDRALATLVKAPAAKFCSQCGFPVQLPENREIRGRRGTYRIQSFLGRQQNGRIYTAVNINNGQPVIVKEYLLPRRSFPEEVTRQYKKEIFERIVNFKVAETAASDFRLIIPQEGISDRNQNRCYLIAPEKLAALPNLKAYLSQQGKMEPSQVINLLDKVLQSLEFLHSQKWQYTSGDLKSGLVHGNLSLDSLLIKQTEVDFLVYLWDLACWEDLFDPRLTEVNVKTQVDDLVALGNIGLYLLAEPTITSQHNYPLNPKDFNWQGIAPEIKSFLLRLLGLNSPFTSAAMARKELRQLKQLLVTHETITTSSNTDSNNNFQWLPWIVLPIALVSLMAWWLLKIKDKPSPELGNFSGELCIKYITNVPDGNFKYGIVASQQLATIFDIQDSYRATNSCNPNVNEKSFLSIIFQNHRMKLTEEPYSDREELISQLDPRNLNFALTTLAPNRYEARFIKDNQEYINETIAYDGFLVYVPFAGCQGDCQELGNYLAQKITLQQLRDIYTTRISYWHQINPNIPDNLEIVVFAPQDTFAIELFKQLIFTDEADIIAFETAMASGKIQQLTNYAMLKQMRNLWQQGVTNGTKKGAIGFHFKDKVYKQCNIYPLAVVNDSADFFPMLIERQNKTGVDLFKNLSCVDNKQEYQLNESVFRDRRYPLAFSLNLLYPNSNIDRNLELGTKMTAILQTKEFQCHLSARGLIPLELSQQECRQ